MIKIKGFSGYPGGKSGSGTYQTIINYIPPFKVFYSLYLGYCGVTRHIKPGVANYLNDIDRNVINNWRASNLPDCYNFSCGDAIDIIKLIASLSDASDVFVYLDPPYRMDARKSQQILYRHEYGDIDHLILLEKIAKINNGCKIMISHYPDIMYDGCLTGWSTHDFYSTTRHGQAQERLYMNYSLGAERHDYRFLGEDFREREKNDRITRNYISKLKRLPAGLRLKIIDELKQII